MTDTTLSLARQDYDAIMRHLVRLDSFLEEAAFGFAVPDPPYGDKAFRVVAWEPVDPDDFLYRSAFNFELADEMRGRVIKRAHDLSASIVEFHSPLVSWRELVFPIVTAVGLLRLCRTFGGGSRVNRILRSSSRDKISTLWRGSLAPILLNASGH